MTKLEGGFYATIADLLVAVLGQLPAAVDYGPSVAENWWQGTSVRTEWRAI